MALRVEPLMPNSPKELKRVRDDFKAAVNMTPAAIEKWLREDVVPIAQHIKSDPGSAFSPQDAWKRLQAHMDSPRKGTRLP